MLMAAQRDDDKPPLHDLAAYYEQLANKPGQEKPRLTVVDRGDLLGVMANAERARAIYLDMLRGRVARAKALAAPPPPPRQKPAKALPSQFYDPPKSEQRDLAVIEVDDTDEPAKLVTKRDRKGRHYEVLEKPQISALANIKGDVLEHYRDRRTITEAEYQVGRLIEHVVGWSNPSGGGQWMQGDRVDAAAAHEWAIAHGVDRADAAVAMSNKLDQTVGPEDRMILVQVIIGGMKFEDLAAYYIRRDEQWAKSAGEEVARYSQRQIEHYAFAFRRALRNVAMKWVGARRASEAESEMRLLQASGKSGTFWHIGISAPQPTRPAGRRVSGVASAQAFRLGGSCPELS